MSNFIKKIKLFNHIVGYSLPILVILNIIILPFIFSFVNFIPEWQENNFLIILFFCNFLIFGVSALLLIIVSIKEFNKKLDKKLKKGKIKNWSDKKIKVFGLLLSIFAFVSSLNFIIGDFNYFQKSINYIYIQHKEPITFIDTVVKEDSGGIAVKFVHYAIFQNQKSEDRYTHMFSAARFKVGKKYEIKIIPDTKYILERKLVE